MGNPSEIGAERLDRIAHGGSADTLPQQSDDLQRALDLSTRRLQPPANIAGYKIHRCLGDGAYGSVWLASEQNTGKAVAIKFYSHRRGLDWSLLNREVEKLAVLYTCRNIVELLDVGWDADPPYYVMEYLENGSLAALLEKGPLPPSEAVRIVRTIVQALVHAHGSGILHCDLKPANILLDKNYEPRLADFGQSRLSHEQYAALGTLFYMAPEQADLSAVPDARWDVYAVGALLYQTLCGQVPYRTEENERRILKASTLEERLLAYQATLREGARPAAHRKIAGVDQRLAAIVDRCLEIDPSKRFPNAQAVLEALDTRARQLARRPLLTLGIIGPAILLFGLGSLAQYALNSAVQSASDSLTARALESDALTARILARSVERELEDRTSELVETAVDSHLQDAIASDASKPWAERQELTFVLNQQKARLDQDRRERGRDLDVSWFLTDAHGNQLYREPYNADTIDKNFAWRDYFHGRPSLQEQPGEKPPSPIEKPYLSHVFESKATNQPLVAISVPVWDAEKDHVIGVLGRTFRLEQLLSAYKPQIDVQGGGRIERLIGLVDGASYHLLDHKWMTEKNMQSVTNGQLRLDQEQRERLRELQQVVHAARAKRVEPQASGLDRDDDYFDPVARRNPDGYGGPWLAAFWPINGTDWIALVQERKALALQPVDVMQARLIQYARLGLAVCCAIIAALWYFIFRAMNERSDFDASLLRANGHSASGP